MSNPYGNNPYGQSSAPDPQQQHDAYGQATGGQPASYQSAPDQYGQSAPSTDPYGQTDPYQTSTNPYDPTPNPYGAYGGDTATVAPAKRSSLLGTLALILGGLGVLVALIMAVIGGNAYASMVDQLGTTEIPDVPPAHVQDEFGTFGVTFLVYLITALPILAGLIMGIIAIATNRGRLFGIIATIVAVLGPVIVFIVFFVIAGPSAVSNTPT